MIMKYIESIKLGFEENNMIVVEKVNFREDFESTMILIIIKLK